MSSQTEFFILDIDIQHRPGAVDGDFKRNAFDGFDVCCTIDRDIQD